MDGRKRSKRSGPLSVSDKIQIVHQVLCQHLKQADVAREHRVTLSRINMLVRCAEKNPRFLSELKASQEAKAEKRKQIAGLIDIINQADHFVDSVELVTKKLIADNQLVCKESEVKSVMRKELGMKFKKVKAISLTANSERNLILRQQFALAFLRLNLREKVIINIDETWIGMSDFRRRKWCPAGSNNSVAQLNI